MVVIDLIIQQANQVVPYRTAFHQAVYTNKIVDL